MRTIPLALLVAASALLPGWSLAVDGTWQEMNPPGRLEASGTYDPGVDRVVIYGGFGSNRVFQDTWLLDPSGSSPWARVPDQGLTPLPSHPGRFFHDPLRDRLLYVFGDDAPAPQQVWQLKWGGASLWSVVSSVESGPTLRTRSSIVFDPIGDRMVFFGGRGPHPTLGTVEWNDVWQLRFSPGPTWSPVATSGTPPPITSDAPAVYDPARGRMLVLIGSELWALSLDGTPTWTMQNLTLPPLARLRVFFDGPRDQLVLFGFRNDITGRPGEVGVVPLSSGAFSRVALSSEVSRTTLTIVHDPVHSLLFALFVGKSFAETGSTYFLGDQTWVLPLDGSGSWTRLGPPLGGTNGRQQAWLVRDPSQSRFLAFGGRDLDLPTPAQPTAVPAPIQHEIGTDGGWRPYALSPGSPVPPSNLLPAGPDRARGLVVGATANGIWLLEPTTGTWTARSSTNTWTDFAPQAAIVDSLGDRVIVMGTTRDPVFQVDVVAAWAAPLGVDVPTWTRLQAAGDPVPAFRSDRPPVLVSDVRRNRVILLGGLARVYALSLAGEVAWIRLADLPSLVITPAIAHDVIHDRLFIYYDGSFDGAPRQFFTWMLSDPPSSARPVVAEGTGPPFAKFWSGAFDTATNRFLLMGGEGGTWEFRVTGGGTPSAASIELECPGVATWTAGRSIEAALAVHVSNSGATFVEYEAMSERAWPGLPANGSAPLVDGSASLVLAVAVPDSVSEAGANRITVIARPAGTAAADTCVLVLVAPGVVPQARVFPNPAVAGAATLAVTPLVEGTVRYEVRQLATGRVVHRRNLGRLGPAPYSVPLVPEGLLPSGVYLVRVVFPDRTVDSKLILLR